MYERHLVDVGDTESGRAWCVLRIISKYVFEAVRGVEVQYILRER